MQPSMEIQNEAIRALNTRDPFMFTFIESTATRSKIFRKIGINFKLLIFHFSNTLPKQLMYVCIKTS